MQNVCKRFQEAGGVLRSVQELGRALAQAASEAEAVVFEEFKLTNEEYYSNVGLHSKLDVKFRKDREQVERDHRNRMVRTYIRVAEPFIVFWNRWGVHRELLQ